VKLSIFSRSALVAGIVSLAAHVSTLAQDDAGVAAEESLLVKNFEALPGEKSLAFEATIADSANGQPQRDVFDFTVYDGAKVPLLTVSFRPVAQSGDPDNDPAKWEVFYAIGDGELISTGKFVDENVAYLYQLNLTAEGVVFSFGPVGGANPADGEAGDGRYQSPPGMPAKYDLNNESLEIVFKRTSENGTFGSNAMSFGRFYPPYDPFFLGDRAQLQPEVVYPVVSPVSEP